MRVFKSINVFTMLRGTSVVSWTFAEKHPPVHSLSVEWSWSGAPDSWEILIAGLTEACSYTDTRRLLFSKDQAVHYRVGAHDQEGTLIEYSCPGQTGRGISWPYETQAYAILNAAAVEIRQNGMPGYLLKKISWGTPCPVCAEFSTGEAMDPNCPTCLGTGMTSGYYNSINLPVLPATRQLRQTPTVATQARDDIRLVRCVAYPVIEREDLWIGSLQNDRYVIDQINVASELKGVPLVYELTLRLLPLSSVEYTDPATDKIDLSQFEVSY